MAERQWGIAKRTEGEDRTPEQMLAQIAGKFPVELEPQLDTLKRPVVLEVACPGWQPRPWPPLWAYSEKPPGYQEGGVRYGAIPVSIEDQVATLVEAVKAGCAMIHTHVRDPKDGFTTEDPELEKTIFEGVFAQVDCITSQHTWKATADRKLDYITHTEHLVKQGGGNKFCQAAVVLFPPGDSYPVGYPEALRAGLEVFAEHKVKPVFKVRSDYNVRKLKRVVFDGGMPTSGPNLIIHDMGHPFGWPLDIDPWMQINLISSIEQTKARIPNSLVGVYSGGRNWMPITMTAILAGVDVVRVGIEDVYWMYPHKDEVIQSNLECISKIIDFCKLIGREVATPARAREVLGIERTS